MTATENSRMHRPAPSRRGQSGQVVVWTAFLLPIILVAAGLTFDVGNMINIRDELTGAVDAAALAGAQALHDPGTNETLVRNAVKNTAAANQVPSLAKNGKTSNPVTLSLNTTNTATGDIVLGTFDHNTKVFTVSATPIDITKVNAIKVNARLGTAAGTLPLAFGALLGMTSYDTTRTSIATIGGPISAQPTTPIAISKDVFTGKAKGFIAPDDILVAYKLDNVAFTGFYGGNNASNVQTYVQNASSIPTIKVGDVISLARGAQGGNFNDMADKYKAGDVILVPVCSFDSATLGTVTGFTSIRIDLIDGSKKWIDGTVVKFKSGTTSKTSTAECYGLDCRSFLVN